MAGFKEPSSQAKWLVFMKSIRFGGPRVLILTFGLPPMITTPPIKVIYQQKHFYASYFLQSKGFTLFTNAWKRSRFMQFDDLGQYVGYASSLLTLVGRILWLTRIFHRQQTGALKTILSKRQRNTDVKM